MRGVRRFPCAAVGNSVPQAHSHHMLSITQWVIWATIVCSQWVAFVPLSDEVICDVPFGVSSLPDKGALKALHPREGGTDGVGDFDPNRLIRCRPGEPLSVTSSVIPSVSRHNSGFKVCT